MKGYRLSIEWSRIFPEDNQPDYDALDHYVEQLKALKQSGITTLVTLQHHTLPIWLKDGWHNPEVVEKFSQYVKLIGKRIYEYTDMWFPINEPAVNCFFGYFTGGFPPGKKGCLSYIKAARNQMRCHLEAYQILKETAPEIPVGFIKQYIIFKPEKDTLLNRAINSMFEYLFNNSFLHGFSKGRLPFSLFKTKGMKESVDIWGLNYYTHIWVKQKFPFDIKHSLCEKTPKTQMGWEMHPEGISTAAARLTKIKKIPIYVTENGIASDVDEINIEYIRKHLAELLKSINSGFDVRGYFYWSLIDNFEWNEGYRPKFGLASVDSEFNRNPKLSGYYLKKIAEKREIIEQINGC